RAAGVPAGILHDFANVPELPRRGANCERALPGLPRTGTIGARKDDRTAHSAGSRYRNAAASEWRRRSGREWWVTGRFVCSARSERACVLRATWRGPLLHNTAERYAGGAWHRVASARAERRGEAENPGGYAERGGVPHQGQRAS